ncbi:hypothetical protein ACFFSY_33630 [Paenibacillus aurantiacus]|uniref:DUF805 domain-containing protein n=1 Tax=Paenibacillus aurantiacus TaxID=1936118 RepID=A0ABV5L0A9_9BACL
MSRLKIDLIAFAVSVSLSIVFFLLVYIFTLTYRGDGHGASGNGNLGILFIIPAIPLYLIALIFTYRIVGPLLDGAKTMLWGAMGLPLVILLCILGEYVYVDNLIRHLRGGPGNPDSVIYNFGWLNQYTNRIYFNAYTFVIGLSLAALTRLVVKRIRNKNH